MLQGVTLYIRSDDTTCQIKGTFTSHFPKHSVDSHALLTIQCRQEWLLIPGVCAYDVSANVPIVLHHPLDTVSVVHLGSMIQRDTCKFDSLDFCEQQGLNH